MDRLPIYTSTVINFHIKFRSGNEYTFCLPHTMPLLLHKLSRLLSIKTYATIKYEK